MNPAAAPPAEADTTEEHRVALRKPGIGLLIAYYLLRGAVYLYYKIYHRVQWIHTERIPLTGPLLIVSNHASNLDPPAVGMSTWRRVQIVAKAELFTNRLLAKAIWILGAFPIARGSSDRAAIRQCIQMLRSGEALLMFPEGTRSQDGRLREAQTGVCMLIAQIPEVTILPVRVDGSFHAFSPGMKFPKPRKVRVIIGEPFTLNDLPQLPTVKKLLYQEIGKEIMARIRNAE